MRYRIVFLVFLFTFAAVAQAPATASSQEPSAAPASAPAKRPNIPDHFTNLTVLRTDIAKPELMGVMKQFSVNMKVRCSYYHAVSDDLSTGSFSSDEKPQKEDARKLMRLIHQATLAPS